MKRIAVYALAVVAGLVAPFVAAASMFAPVTIPAAVVFQSAVHTGRVDTFRMPSSSMEPTLHCARPAHGCQADRSDRFMTVDWGEPGRGDIIVFETPPEAVSRCGAGGTFVKRVVGLPGERVDMRLEDGVAFVYVDGRRLDEPYIENDRRDIGPAESFRVPPDHYFVLGDNRSQSCDSRVWGSVPAGNVRGRVVLRYWPPGRVSTP